LAKVNCITVNQSKPKEGSGEIKMSSFKSIQDVVGDAAELNVKKFANIGTVANHMFNNLGKSFIMGAMVLAAAVSLAPEAQAQIYNAPSIPMVGGSFGYQQQIAPQQQQVRVGYYKLISAEADQMYNQTMGTVGSAAGGLIGGILGANSGVGGGSGEKIAAQVLGVGGAIAGGVLGQSLGNQDAVKLTLEEILDNGQTNLVAITVPVDMAKRIENVSNGQWIKVSTNQKGHSVAPIGQQDAITLAKIFGQKNLYEEKLNPNGQIGNPNVQSYQQNGYYQGQQQSYGNVGYGAQQPARYGSQGLR
jgi:outer membrane lipoprotein SlyB